MLLTKDSVCLIQGMTGKEGQRTLKWMSTTGLKVAAGVTPGKGGQDVDGVPVYNSIKEALAAHPEINLSSIYVPPKFVLGAANEAIDSKIPVIHILAEGVPTIDTAKIIEKARQNNVRVVGPSSIGFAIPGIGAVGSMGGGNMSQFLAPKNNDGVAILSKSGGMANTIATMLTSAGIPQSFVIGLGGDRFIGTTYADLIPDLAADPNTKAVVIVGEIGGAYEEVFAEEVKKQNFTKPVVGFISGMFAETLPQGVAFGHAGAIVSKTEGTRQAKLNAFKNAGIQVADKPSQITEILKKL